VSTGGAGEPKARFFTMVHRLRDCAVAAVYCDETKAGPAEIVAVIPAEHRACVRADFAFEFVAFASFLAALGDDADMRVHDGIAAALAETVESDSLIFSISTGLCGGDPDPALSRCVEKIAVAMLHWLMPGAPDAGPRPAAASQATLCD
jgi:hypothetical protein